MRLYYYHAFDVLSSSNYCFDSRNSYSIEREKETQRKKWKMFAKTFRDEKDTFLSPHPLHLSVAFFPGCSDSQPHPRASDNTVLNGRGQTRSRSPRYFATFQAFNLARVPLLAIVPMIVGWESLSPLRVFFFFFPLPP